MKQLFRPESTFFALLTAVMLLAGGRTFSRQNTEWDIGYDTNGQIHSMTIEEPKTDLNIEREIRIETDVAGIPVKGMVTFNDGVSRALSPMEIRVYLWKFDRPPVAWDLANSNDYIEIFDPSKQEIGYEFWGRPSRVITRADGKEFQGTLLAMNSNPQWFNLRIDDNIVSFYRPVVGRIQQIRIGYELRMADQVSSIAGTDR